MSTTAQPATADIAPLDEGLPPADQAAPQNEITSVLIGGFGGHKCKLARHRSVACI